MFVKEISNLRGALWAILPDSHRLDDVIQETFLIVSRKAADFQDGTNFQAWIFAIGRNKALQSLRERRLDSLLSPDVLENLTEEMEMTGDFEDRMEALRECVGELPKSGREMIDLRYAHAKSLPEMSDMLAVKTGSIKVMLSRYRALLRTCMEKKLSIRPR